MTDAMKVVFL